MASLKSEERWQTKTSTVLERSKYIFNNLLLSDIKFAFPNTETTIPAHKHVLAVSSPVFFTMFYGDLAETRDTIDLTDCDSDIFLRFLRFIYCDEANFEDIDCAIKVWYLADKYDVPSLARESVKYLDGNMDPLSAFDVLICARQFSDEGMETACWEVIDYNAEAIVADDSFLDLKHELLLSLLERSSKLRIEEAALFKALDRWAAKRCEEASSTVNGENKRAFMGEDLLNKIRFSLMSPNEFSDVVLPTEILLLTEAIDVFKKFASVSIPDGFKFSENPGIRKACHEALYSQSTGNVSVPGADFSTSRVKSGLLTFAVNRDISLCGVKIVTNKGRESCRVSLSITKGGRKMKQINDKYFNCDQSVNFSSNYGEIDVVFNRPFFLTKNTCYTVETSTDTTTNLYSGYVCQKKLLTKLETTAGLYSAPRSFILDTSHFGSSGSLPSSNTTDKDDIISFYCFRHCDQNCPEHSTYSGEIMKLVFRG